MLKKVDIRLIKEIMNFMDMDYKAAEQYAAKLKGMCKTGMKTDFESYQGEYDKYIKKNYNKDCAKDFYKNFYH